MNYPVRVLQYGFGPIGRACANVLLEKEHTGLVHLVGAVDIHPELAGRDMSEVLALQRRTGIRISNDARAALRAARPDVVVHTTSSFLERIYDQIATCLDAGASVVSSSEELFYPYERHPDLARSLDELARDRGVAVLGTGVNPGFAMDVLALVASGICTDVRAIRIKRVVDASRRREPLQRKIGAGLSLAAFRERLESITFGHVGLRESALFVANGLGWNVEHVDEAFEPVTAASRVETPYLSVEPEHVAGIHQRVVARGSHRELELDLQMYVGAPDAHDAVFIDGDPPVDLVVRGGIFGDTATIAALVNSIPVIAEAEPGLRLASELPIPRAFATANGRA